jgi:hypothetical protein
MRSFAISPVSTDARATNARPEPGPGLRPRAEEFSTPVVWEIPSRRCVAVAPHALEDRGDPRRRRAWPS